MTETIFTKIAQGEMTTPGIFWENETHMAMLSINPNTKGFTVVFPKEYQNSDVMKLSDTDLTALMLATKEVAAILEQHFDDVGRVGVMMEGLGVNHAHVKLFPMHGTEELKEQWRSYDSDKEFWFEHFEGWMSSGPGPDADYEELRLLAEALKQTAQ